MLKKPTKIQDVKQRAHQVIKQAHNFAIPTKKEQTKIKGIADMLLTLVNYEAAKHPEIKRVETGGSYRKDTWVANSEMDIDVYLVFDYNVDRKKFKDIGVDVGKKSLKNYKPYIKFAEHPYVEAKFEAGILVNVVPCYEIVESKEWKSSTDRTQLHTEYMTRQLNQNKRNQVRLLKAFLKANGLYGAEIAKNGFSGYVSEVLIAHFGSCEKTIKKFANINSNHTIGHARKEFSTSITIMDPIDSNRNLAAAISYTNMIRFILACRSFLHRPTVEFFDVNSMKKSKKKTIVNECWNNTLTIKFGFEKRPPDSIWGQTKKSITKLVKLMERDGFPVLRYGSFVDVEKRHGYLFVLLNSVIIPSTYEMYGPEFERRKDLDMYIRKSFADKAEMMWVDKQGRLVALKKRSHTVADKYVRYVLKENSTLLPVGQTIQPKVWIGEKNLSGAVKEAVEEVISTDTTIVYLN